MVFTVSYAFWSWLSAQQSDRIILWEHYGNNIRLPKHYSMAGESSVTSDTTVWQGAQLAIHFLHPVIIITSDIIINQTSNRPCAACLTPSHTCQVCAQTVYTQSISEVCKHTRTHALKHRVPQKRNKDQEPNHTGSIIKENISPRLSCFICLSPLPDKSS